MNLDEQNIIAALGLSEVPEDKKIAMLDKLTDLLQKRLMVRLIKSLSDADQKSFADILEKNNPSAVQNFIAEHAPEFPAWLQEEVNNLKQEAAEYIQHGIPS